MQSNVLTHIYYVISSFSFNYRTNLIRKNIDYKFPIAYVKIEICESKLLKII